MVAVGVDLTVLALIWVFMIALDVIGARLKIGLFFMGSGMMGALATGEIFSTGNATTAIYYEATTVGVPLSPVDATLCLALNAVLTIMSVSLIFYVRNRRIQI